MVCSGCNTLISLGAEPTMIAKGALFNGSTTLGAVSQTAHIRSLVGFDDIRILLNCLRTRALLRRKRMSRHWNASGQSQTLVKPSRIASVLQIEISMSKFSTQPGFLLFLSTRCLTSCADINFPFPSDVGNRNVIPLSATHSAPKTNLEKRGINESPQR